MATTAQVQQKLEQSFLEVYEKAQEATIQEIFKRMNADLLQSFAQSLYDDLNWKHDADTYLLLNRAKEAYAKLTGKEVKLTYNCPA
jgi:ABC-type phosphate transport system auxiliary subunit